MQVSSDASLSHMTMQWGQFLDHDVSHSMESISGQTFVNGAVGDDAASSACGATCDNRAPCFPIQVGFWIKYCRIIPFKKELQTQSVLIVNFVRQPGFYCHNHFFDSVKAM